MATRPMPKPIGRPLPGPTNRSLDRSSLPAAGIPTTETALPDRERQRDHARKTAAKIDAIEAEMARDLMQGLGRNSGAPAPAPSPSAAPATIVRSGNTLPPMSKPTTIVAAALDVNSEMLGGNIDAIEINTSGGSSVIDETAILFSNGQIDAAEAMLRAGLRRHDRLIFLTTSLLRYARKDTGKRFSKACYGTARAAINNSIYISVAFWSGENYNRRH